MGRGKSAASNELISKAREILKRIQPASVRAVCYQLFDNGHGLIPNMSKGSTDRVSIQLVYARVQGIIPWEWIVDETRHAERANTWSDPEQYAEAVALDYRRDRWHQQPQQIEVWSEKGTVRGTIGPILDEWGVTFRVIHGYSSATLVQEVARATRHLTKPLKVVYVGDWDPSGMHMSEVDLPRRAAAYGGNIAIRRVALSLVDTIAAEPKLPSFSVEEKKKDPRYKWFKENYGDRCWELDSLDPNELRSVVDLSIRHTVGDADAWNRCERAEKAERESLLTVMNGWKAALAT